MVKWWKSWRPLRRHPMEWFEQANMEDVMDPRPDRQGELVGHIPHTLQHLIRTKELRSQFATTFDLQRRHWPVEQTQPHPLSRLKLNSPVSPIIHRLVVLLSLFQTVADFSQELIAVLQSTLHSRQTGFT
jgi:hypothetical protein